MKHKIITFALLAFFLSSCETGEIGDSNTSNENSQSETSHSVANSNSTNFEPSAPTSNSESNQPSFEPSVSTSTQNSASASFLPSESTSTSTFQPETETIRLQYAGSKSNRELNELLFEHFKNERKEAGDLNTYVIEYVECPADRIDGEINDWEVGPDVYEFVSDKFANLYRKGALSQAIGENANFIEQYNNQFALDLATLNSNYYAYPYCEDNTYFVQYDTSFFTAEDVKSIETMLDKAQKYGKKIGYQLKEAFWGGAAMFTFGADFEMTFDESGNVNDVKATFNSEEGFKAAKAIKMIMEHPAWQNEMAAPTKENNLVACIAGRWDVATYKEYLGNNYGCAVMPTVTIDGDTKHLGSLMLGNLLGVNPQRADGDINRLNAAHELAKFLSNKECQLMRFDIFGVAPCNIEAIKEERVLNNSEVKVLIEQAEFAHAQNATPAALWYAPNDLTHAIADGTIIDDNSLYEAIKTLNDAIIASR